MQRPIFARVPIVTVAAPSLPPMYDWPNPVKRAILGTCIVLCIIAYTAMAAGIVGLTTLLLGLL